MVAGNNVVSPYKQVIERNNSISIRSQMLVMNIEKEVNQNSRSETSNLQIKTLVSDEEL